MALKGQLAGERCHFFRHGHTTGDKFSPTYISWTAMIARCCNPRSYKYPQYGGRGITVCDRWRDFVNFLADMGERPEGTTLDRINRDGHYEPTNCRWATSLEQAQNRRPFKNHNALKTHCPQGHPYSGSNLHITLDGNRKCRMCEKIRQQAKRDQAKAERKL